jgi:hypothetical protein
MRGVLVSLCASEEAHGVTPWASGLLKPKAQPHGEDAMCHPELFFGGGSKLVDHVQPRE